MRQRRESSWKTEAALCAAFKECAEADGWTVYPECSGWDLLVVKDDIQVGIEAKLRPNLDCLGQALERMHGSSGPDFAAVLIPKPKLPDFDSYSETWSNRVKSSGRIETEFSRFREVAKCCAVTVVRMAETWDRRTGVAGFRHEPSLPTAWKISGWYPLLFEAPCWTPPYVPDLPAGVPSPVVLTRWKIEAVRLCVLLRSRGYLTSADFKAAKVSPTYWTQALLTPDGREGKLTRYVARPGVKLPDEQHPDIAARMAEELTSRPEVVEGVASRELVTDSEQAALFVGEL